MSEDRRNYFRIDDYLHLELRPVERQTLAHTPVENLFPGSEALKIYAELRRLDAESQQLYHQIKDRDRQLAEYLYLLNRKTDLLAQQLVSKPDLAGEEPYKRSVNLSEGGIAFSHDQPLDKASYLALNLIFLPSYVHIPVYALVTRCDPHHDKGYEIGAEFQKLSDAQQQLIGQQIMRAQLADKRRRQALNSL